MNRLFILSWAVLLFFGCNHGQEGKNNRQGKNKDTLSPVTTTLLAGLHDSLQPRVVALDTMPAPLKVNVPQKDGGSYTKRNRKGREQSTDLLAPKKVSLPVLQDEAGKPVTGTSGKPFLMGDGGLSDFTYFNTDHGLALDGITCAAMDKHGNLWFGTEGGGVSRYDGQTFTNFTTAHGLPNNVLRCITEDRKGNLWFGFYGSPPCRYDGNTFTELHAGEGMALKDVWSILEDKAGNLWFGTYGAGVFQYDGKTFKQYTTEQGLSHNIVLCMLEDQSGNLWFGGRGGHVDLYRPSRQGKPATFTNYGTSQGLTGQMVLCLQEDKNGHIWAGTDGGGVSKITVNRGQAAAAMSITNYNMAHGLAHMTVKDILEDRNGNLWFATDGGGVSRLEPETGSETATFTSFNSRQGLSNDHVWTLTEDRSGNIWMGTYGSGLCRYNGRAVSHFNTTHGLLNYVIRTIMQDKQGHYWFGGEGISRYDGQSMLTYTENQGLGHNTVWSSMQDRTGKLWFGTDRGGVSCFDPEANGRTGRFTTFTPMQGFASYLVYYIFEDSKGDIWFGTGGKGLCRYSAGKTGAENAGRKPTFTTYTKKQGLSGNTVWTILEDQTGGIWTGTYGGGISRFDGKTFCNLNVKHGLASDYVYSSAMDASGNIWFGTEGGLSLILAEDVKKIAGDVNAGKKPLNISSRFIRKFGMNEGLPNNVVTQVLALPDGKMAVGTNLGITVFRLSDDKEKLSDVAVFNTATGYPVKDVNAGQNGMYLDRQGVIWAGTGSEKTALVRFDYKALMKNAAAPALVIRKLKVSSEDISWHQLAAENADQIMPAQTVDEVGLFGRELTTKQRDSMRTRFGNIRFSGVQPFYALPLNLVLPYEHNHVSFDFTAIETGKPFLVRYQYMLEGYDKDWSPATGQNRASFGNIREGTYTFKVRAKTGNSGWTAPVTFVFSVLPPWYRTWWAYGIYIVLFLAGLRAFSKWRERRLKAENEKLEMTVRERTAELVEKNIIVEREKKRSEDLLLNILPEEVAEELKAKGSADAKLIDEVTVLFTDFKGFTQLSEKLSPKELVQEINECFSAFDYIMQKYGVEKIKTIGDAYMAAGGLPTSNDTHANDVIRAALEIQQYMLDHKTQRQAAGSLFFEIRIGVHTGPVVAGIVGVKKFAYDIWGDTVNTASRMESSGEIGKVNISGTTYELIKDEFHCTYRGKIQAKNKGEIDMYFVEGVV